VLHHAHESPWVMTVPLAVLSLLTLVAGFVFGLPLGTTRIAHLLGSVFAEREEGHAAVVVLVSVAVFAAGLGLAMYRYRMTPVKADTVGRARTPVHALLINAYYVDWIYDQLIVRPLLALAIVLAHVVDLGGIDGIVNGVGRMITAWGAGLRRVQSGYVVNYALTMLAGAVVVIAFLLVR
jgi:NADH-quinone oxidoreductase subunit L